METTDPTAEPVQPEDAGQGTTGGDAPYAEYLNRIPEEVRGDVEPVFRDWDANTTRKFQEAAEYRSAWEPYEQLGVNQVPVERMQWALQFLDAHDSNPQAVIEWASQYAQENGIQFGDQPSAPEQGLDELGFGVDPQAIDQLLESRLSPLMQRLEQFDQQFAQQAQEAALHEAKGYVDAAMQQVPGEVDRNIFEAFLGKYAHDGFLDRFGANKQEAANRAVQSALADYQKAQALFEKGALSSKLGAPPGAEPGGPADGAPEPIKTLAEATRIAQERLRANRG